MNTKYFFTNHGNVLIAEENRQYFQTLDGEFLRPCSDRELNYLLNNGLFEFAPVSALKLALRPDDKFPQWFYLRTLIVEANYENYQWDLATNGGRYSFHTYCHIFFSQQPNGTFRFGYIEEMKSSADFTITWDGKFQNDNTNIVFSNCETSLSPLYHFQVFDADGNREYCIIEPIEKYLEIVPIDTIFAMEHVHIPERDSGESISYRGSFSDNMIEETLEQLAKFGFQYKKKEKRRR